MKPSKKDISFLNLAQKLACTKVHKDSKWKFGSVLVSSGRVISTGVNKTYKTNYKQLEEYKDYNNIINNNIYTYSVNRIHSELDCLCKLKTKCTKKMTLYISRNTNYPSRPCEVCMNTIRKYGVKRIVYRTLNGIKVENL